MKQSTKVLLSNEIGMVIGGLISTSFLDIKYVIMVFVLVNAGYWGRYIEEVLNKPKQSKSCEICGSTDEHKFDNPDCKCK